MRPASDSITGLTTADVEARIAAGQVNRVESHSSRSVGDILRANILTRFNAIITVLLAVIVVFGDLRDALFGIVMVVNTAIGIVQELRAKRTLDRLTVLATPIVAAMRDGMETQVPVSDLVLDDVVIVYRGDQVPVDGEVIVTEGFQVDESLLTGEADPVDKSEGAKALSGSFVVAGSGAIMATAVGADAYANELAAEAREFALAQSELLNSVNRILEIVTWLLVPTTALLLWRQWEAVGGRRLDLGRPHLHRGRGGGDGSAGSRSAALGGLCRRRHPPGEAERAHSGAAGGRDAGARRHRVNRQDGDAHQRQHRPPAHRCPSRSRRWRGR